MALTAKKAPASGRQAMKAKRVSKIARGRFAKALVLRGSKEKTVGGLTRDALTKNKRGKIVSKRAAANGKRRYQNIAAWVDSVVEARKALQMQGFVAINGRSVQGKALYVKSKSLFSARSSTASAE
mmetsp:Transcript_77923/g.158319  ORF Transcript_77923/g.158319 Transcript_77923/m.158319 type:complete len:126 (-) Transcript_77923:140-517(-)